jgi:hypothetical protein
MNDPWVMFFAGLIVGFSLSYWMRRTPRKASLEERIRVLEVKPGDIAVLTTPRALPPEAVANLKAAWEAHAPNVKCMVFEDGLDVKVRRPPVE